MQDSKLSQQANWSNLSDKSAITMERFKNMKRLEQTMKDQPKQGQESEQYQSQSGDQVKELENEQKSEQNEEQEKFDEDSKREKKKNDESDASSGFFQEQGKKQRLQMKTKDKYNDQQRTKTSESRSDTSSRISKKFKNEGDQHRSVGQKGQTFTRKKQKIIQNSNDLEQP